MYFNDHMFNPQYVNPSHYQQVLGQPHYIQEQDQRVMDAVKAFQDLCKAVKGMDEQHQQVAFYACLAEMAVHFGWNR